MNPNFLGLSKKQTNWLETKNASLDKKSTVTEITIPPPIKNIHVPVIVSLASSCKIPNVRPMRKKELLRQYYEQTVPENKLSKFREKIPSKSCKRYYFPKAIYSITSLPSAADYKETIQANLSYKQQEKIINGKTSENEGRNRKYQNGLDEENRKNYMKIKTKKPYKRKNNIMYNRKYFGERKKRKRKCKKNDVIDNNNVSKFIVLNKNMQYSKKIVTEYVTDEIKTEYFNKYNDLIFCSHVNTQNVNESGFNALPIESIMPHSSNTLKMKLVKYEEGYYLIKKDISETNDESSS